jgi:pimeloyl-ACP methyl ester carboxylesterase
LRGELSDILSPVTAEEMVKANPRIRWVQIPGATHFVHSDKPAAFNHEVAHFLAEL